jgi:hypothetical protein
VVTADLLSRITVAQDFFKSARAEHPPRPFSIFQANVASPGLEKPIHVS